MDNVFHIPTIINLAGHPLVLIAGVLLVLVLLQRHGARKAQRAWYTPARKNSVVVQQQWERHLRDWPSIYEAEQRAKAKTSGKWGWLLNGWMILVYIFLLNPLLKVFIDFIP